MKVKHGRELIEFNRSYKELDGIFHEIAQNMGLSNSAFAILYTLVEFGGGCLQKDIAEYFSTSRQTINSSIKNLEEKGIISLEKGNRREQHLYLTSEGQKLAEEKIVPVVEMENHIFAAMEPEESQKLLQLTKKLVSLYRKEVDERRFLNSRDEQKEQQ